MSPKPKAIHELGTVILASENYVEYQGKYLMHRRSSTKSRFPGYLIGPGGRIDEHEDVITAAVREIKEETGVTVEPQKVRLRVVAIHHHLDREEVWVNFITFAHLNQAPGQLQDSDEGTSVWLAREELHAQEKVFQASEMYFEHMLGDQPGIVYTNSEWRAGKLVRELSHVIV